MKMFSTLLGLCLFFLQLDAQQTIRGTVIDKDAKTPLIGAVVTVLRTDPPLAAVTDELGRFEILEAPIGRCGLEVRFLGYEPLVAEGLLLTPSRELNLNLEMTEAVSQLTSVEVTARTGNEALNEASAVSSLSFNMEALERQPANFSDPSRMALNFPGVAYSGDDLSNDIVVRGNSPAGVLWRLEGIEIPNPNHFVTNNGTGGNITMLSANAMAGSDFFSGAFPAEYGNALSGVMDIRMNTGNANHRENTVQVGFLGLDLASEGPFRKGRPASYILNYRYSTLGFLQKLGVSPTGREIPNFQDLSFKFNLPTKKMGTFSIFGLGGIFLNEEKITLPNEMRKDKESGKTNIIGLSHLLFLSNKTYLKTVLAHTYANLDSGSGDYSSTGEYNSHDKNYYLSKSLRASVMLNHKFNAKHSIRFGGSASWESYKLNMEQEDFELTFDNNGFPHREYLGHWTTYLDSKGNTGLAQAFAQWKGNLSDKLTINIGAHFTYFHLNKNTATEPRLGVKWQISKRHALLLGAGIHSRIEALPTYFVQKGDSVTGHVSFPHRSLPLQQSRQLVLGYKMQVNQIWTLKAETYFQQLSRMPVSSDSTSTYALLNTDYGDLFFRTDSLTGKGKGRNYGLDLSLERRFEQQFYALLNSSIFQSEFKTLEGAWHSSLFNANYNLVLVGGKEFTLGQNKNNILGINLRYILNGGLRYTPLDREASLAEEASIYSEETNSKHLPVYWRIDIGGYYRFNSKKILHSISLNLQNASFRLNVYDRNERYDPNVPGKIWQFDSEQTGLLPVLNYRVEF